MKLACQQYLMCLVRYTKLFTCFLMQQYAIVPDVSTVLSYSGVSGNETSHFGTATTALTPSSKSKI